MGLWAHAMESKCVLRTMQMVWPLQSECCRLGICCCPEQHFTMKHSCNRTIQKNFLVPAKNGFLQFKSSFESCVRIWNLLGGIGSLSCLIDLLSYLFREWVKKLYFGPYCSRPIKNGIASQDFLWHTDAEKSKLAIFSPYWTVYPPPLLDSLFTFSAALEPATKFLPVNVK